MQQSDNNIATINFTTRIYFVLSSKVIMLFNVKLPIKSVFKEIYKESEIFAED